MSNKSFNTTKLTMEDSIRVNVLRNKTMRELHMYKEHLHSNNYLTRSNNSKNVLLIASNTHSAAIFVR